MAAPTLTNYLAELAEDPDDSRPYDTLRDALTERDPSVLGEDPIRLLELARMQHEQRGEARAAAWLIELEGGLVRDDPDLEAALYKELGRLKHEELLDDAGAKSAFERALSIRPNDAEIRAAIEQVELTASNWKEFAKRFVEEADDASDATLKTSLLVRAAGLLWQYKKRSREKEVDKLFRAALEADPAATKAARLYAETLRQRERWEDLGQVLLQAADQAKSRDEKLHLYVRAARTFARRLSSPELAARCYERVLDFVPAHEEALGYLVDYFTERQDWDHLIALYEDALRSRQKLEHEQGVLFQIAMVHWRIRHRAQEAEPYFARLRKIDPAHAGMLGFYREFLRDAQDPQRLLTILTDALRVSTDEGQKRELAIELARTAERSESTIERAIDAWKSVQRIDPQSTEARVALKALYRRAEKWNALVELLKQELDALPAGETDARVSILREMVAIYRDALGLDVMVVNTYNAILQLVPDDRESLDSLAATYESMGRSNDLIQVLTRQAEIAKTPSEKVATLMRVANLWIERFANYNQATRPLEEVIALDPQNREALTRLREIYEKKRAWKPLFEVLKRESELASDPAARLSSRIELAKLAGERLHRHADAIALWREVVREAPATEGALESLEKLADREKDWPTLAEALELRVGTTAVSGGDASERVKLLQRLGTIYSDHIQDPLKAANAWKRVLELDPRNGRATRTLREAFLAAEDWESLEALYREAGDFEGLVDVLGTAADRTRDADLKVRLSFRAAEIFERELEEPHRAFRNYERVLAARPTDVRAARALLPIYEKDGNWARARAMRELLYTSLDPKAPAAERLGLLSDLRAMSLDRLADASGAFGFAKKAFELAPADPSVVAALEDTAEKSNAHDELFQLYKARVQAAKDEDERMRLRRAMARIAGERLGRGEEAIAQLEAILVDRPDDRDAVEVLDRLYRAQNRVEDLHRLFVHRAEHAEDRTERYRVLGELARLEEDVLDRQEQATLRYREMLEIDPKSLEALEALDRIYTATGDSKSIASVTERLRDLSNDPRARAELTVRLARLATELDDIPAAIARYSEVLEAFSGHEDAVSGLEALEADHPEHAAAIAPLLEHAYEVRSADEKLAAILERRLERTSDRAERRDLLLRLGELYGSLRDREGAYGAVERAFVEHPADVELWDRLEGAAAAARKEEAIATTFGKALEGGSLSKQVAAELAERTARVYEDVLGSPERAEPFHRRVLSFDPQSERAFSSLKELYTTRERWEELQVLYRNRIAQTVDADAKRELLLQVCFLFEELLDEPESAIRAYQDVLDLDPSHVPARRALDRLYRRTERYRDLAELLRHDLDAAAGQDRVDLMVELGEIYEKRLREPGPAVDYYEAVLRENPTHLRSQEALERLLAHSRERQRIAAILEPLYQGQGAYPELAKIYAVQLEDVSDRGSRVTLLTRIAELQESKLHDADAAFKALSQAVLADPSDAMIRGELARLARIRGSEAEHADVLERAISNVDETYLRSELLLELARLFDEQVGDPEAAERTYLRLIETDRDNPDVVLPASRALERLHLAKGDHAALAEDLRRQIKLDENPAEQRQLLLRLATLLEDTLEDLDGAITAHRQRAELDPSDEDALRSLERLFEQKNEWQRLIGILKRREQITDSPDEQREIGKRIGAIYEEKLDDPDDAIVAYNDTLARFGSDRGTLAALTRLYFRTERWGDLLEVIERDLDVAEDPVERSELRFRAAELMREKTGELERAIEAYAEVLANAPDHEDSVGALYAIMRGAHGSESISAARVLAPRLEGSGDYQRLLEVLDVLAESHEHAERLRALRRAAEVAEVGVQDPPRAFDLTAKAVRAGLSEPEIGDMLADLERLAGLSGRYPEYMALLRGIEPDLFDGDLQRATRLKIAEVAHRRLDDGDTARTYYWKVLEEQPDHRQALDALEDLFASSKDTAGLLEVLRRKAELAEGRPRVELLLRRADLSEESGADLDAAIDAYEEVLNESEHEKAYAGLERLYEKTERWSELAALLERRLERNAGEPVEIRYRLGQVLRKHLDDRSRAIEEYRAALDTNPDHGPSIDALTALMVDEDHRVVVAEILEPVYLRRLDWSNVIATLEARVRSDIDPEEKKALLGRMGGYHEDALGDLDGALETYARLFREDPRDAEVWETLSRLARNQDKHVRLAQIYDESLRSIDIDDQSTAELAFITGRLYDERVHDLEQAIVYYARALRFDPTRAEVFLALEATLVRGEKREERLALYREQLTVAESDAARVDLLHKSGILLREELGDLDGAASIYEELLEIDPEDASAIAALDAIYTERERWTDLADLLRRRVDQNAGSPAEIDLRFRLGELLWRKIEDQNAAIDAFEEVTARSPSHTPTIRALEELVQGPENQRRVTGILEPIYRASDEWKKLVAILEARVGLSDDPAEKVELLGEIGRLHEERGRDAARAFGAWTRAFVIAPDSDARAEVDRLAAILDAWDDHVRSYESAIVGSSDPALISNMLSTIARVHDERRGDPRSAIQTYERLVAHDPDDPTPLDSLDALHTMVGDWRGLVEVLMRKAERSYDPSERGELLRRAGSVLEELLGDRDGAIEAYRRAAEEDPDDAIALAALDRLYAQAGESEKLAAVLSRRVELERSELERVDLGLRLGYVYDTQLNRASDAISAFARVLEDHANHPEALHSLARLYERQALWPELLENLRTRAGVAEKHEERVNLVHRAGEVLERELDDVPEALAMYHEALELDAAHEPSIAALLRISKLEDYRAQAAEIVEPRLSHLGRFDDLATLVLAKAEAASDPHEKRDELRRLAEIHERGRGDRQKAFEALARALAEDPGDESIVDELERLSVSLGNDRELADTLTSRATSALDPNVAQALWVRLARIAEDRLGDDRRAIEAYSRAAEQIGDEPSLLAALDRLYLKTEGYNQLGAVLERRIAVTAEPAERSELLVRLGGLREQHHGDLRGAYEAYREVLERDPSDAIALSSMERLLAEESLAADVVQALDEVYRHAGDLENAVALYDVRVRLADSDGERVRLLHEAARLYEEELHDPARALERVRQAFSLDPRESALLEDLERLAGATGSWESLRGVVERVVGETGGDRTLVRDLNLRAASWYRDRLDDRASAEGRLRDAIEADPDAGEAHRELVALLRDSPDRIADLVSALIAWSAAEVDDHAKIERLREALALSESRLGDLAGASRCAAMILDIDSADREALDDLIRLKTLSQDFDAVVELLGRRIDVEPDPAARLALRHQLAEVYGGPLRRPTDAIEGYRAVLEEEPSDLTAIAALEELYEGESRWDDMQELLERRLDIATSTDEQIAARVRLARLQEQRFGRRAEAIEQLEEILGLDPHNREALDELERLLAADERWDALVDLLEGRSHTATGTSEIVSVLGRLAGVQEEKLADEPAAIATLERIVSVDSENSVALSALVRLHRKRGAFEPAADALERLAQTQAGLEAVSTYQRLAELRENELGDPRRATAALRRAFELEPSSATTRELLKAHYQKHGEYLLLAELLEDEERRTNDRVQKVELLKRIAGLYAKELDDPGRAAVQLERASELVPEDREVLLPLCDLYIAAGRSRDAVPVLEKIIESYGTRRVKEVAQYHHRLGRALEELGDQKAALDRFDAAFKIDLTNVGVLRDLGRLCHRTGDLDRAQKTFRALLLQKLDHGAGISKADVYFYLGDISAKQGDKSKAISMLQRAVAEDPKHESAQGLLGSLR
jgi:tetratricopeptide (TPR) repeat protein